MNNNSLNLVASRAKYRVLGTNDDASDCLCCGRQGLKRVVWLQPLADDGDDDGQPVHFGTMCAARACGWGYSSRDDAARRIVREEAEAVKHYRGIVSAAMKALIQDGFVVQTRVAYGFNWKSADWNYGYIYTLPGDPIIRAVTPEAQRAEVPAAKARLRAKYPLFEATERNLTVFEMRERLAAIEKAVA